MQFEIYQIILYYVLLYLNFFMHYSFVSRCDTLLLSVFVVIVPYVQRV